MDLRSKAYAGEIIEFRRGKSENVIAIGNNGRFLGEGKDRDEAFKDAKQTLHEKYERESGITPTKRGYQSKELPLENLQAIRDKKWEEMAKVEERGMREGWSPDKIYEARASIAKRYEAQLKKPNMQPLIYRTSIGHYGGLYVDVPEEHFDTFKEQFPPREFPRKVRTVDVRDKYSFEGEKRFRQRFPNSNRLKEVYFANGSKGLKRLDFYEMPKPE